MNQTPRKLAVFGFLALSLFASGISWLMPRVRADKADPPSVRPEAAALDRHGFPLPAGATTRLGTLAFRHEGRITALAYTPDGKRIASGDEHGTIHIWDVVSGRELRQLRGHLNPVVLLTFSSDGKRLASGELSDVPPPPPAAAAPQRKRDVLVAFADNALPGEPAAEQMTPEEAAARQNGQTFLWDLSNNKVLCRVGPGEAFLPFAAFSPDGNVLATRGTASDTVQLWDAATGKAKVTLTRMPHYPQAVAFLANGTTVATVGVARDGQVKDNEGAIPGGGLALWDASSGRQKRLFLPSDQMESINAAVFAPDGKSFVFLAGNGNFEIWESTTGKLRGQLKRKGNNVLAPNEAIPTLVYAPDGKTLAVQGGDQKVRLWNLGTEQLELTLRTQPLPLKTTSPPGTPNAPAPASVFSPCSFPPEPPPAPVLAFAPDSKALAVSGDDHSIHFWDLTTGQERPPIAGHRLEVSAVAFAPDGKLLASAGADRTILLWDPTTQQEVRQLRGHTTGPVTFLAFSPDGKLLASGGPFEEVIRLWDVAEGKEIRQFPSSTWPQQWRNTGRFPSVEVKVHAAFTPDGRTLLTREYRQDDKTMLGLVVFWDVQTGKEQKKVGVFLNWDFNELPRAAPANAPAPPAAAPAAPAAAPAAAPEKEAKAESLLPHNFAFALSADGKVLATTGTANNSAGITLWDTANGKSLRSFDTTNDVFLSFLQFAPDGKTLAGVALPSTPPPQLSPFGAPQPKPGEDGSVITLYDVASGDELHELEGHDGIVTDLSFSPDSKRLASVSHDKTLRLWDVSSGRHLRHVTGHLGPVLAVAFSPESTALATGSGDATVLLWKTSELLRKDRPSASLKQLEALWTDLGSADASRAGRAMRELGASGGAVTLLEQRLQPKKVDAALAKRIDGWIDELENDKFADREKAASQLEKCGELAEGALQKALGGKPSLEAKQRIEQILKKIEEATLSGEQVRSLRAVEVLEQIGSSEARRVLETLATGAPEVQLTQEAKAAAQRLARRAGP